MAGEINFGAVDPQAFFKGAANMNDLLQRYTQQKAGKLLSTGNRAGAVQELQGSGQLDAARALETQGQQNFAYDQAQDDRHTKLDDAHKKQSAELIVETSDALTNVFKQHGAEAAVSAFDQLVPIFKQRGATDEELATYKQALVQNPEQFLTAMNSQGKKALEQYTLTPGSQRYDAQGRMIAEAPLAPQYRTVGEGQSLVEVPAPGGAPAGPGAAPTSLTPEVATAAVQKIFPGATVTSIDRTPAHNAEVGGVPNSLHLKGEAMDFVKPPGATIDQVRAGLVSQGLPISELIDEGDHIHWAWGAKGAPAAPAAPGAPRVIATGGPKTTGANTKWRPASQAELDVYGAEGGQINETTGEFKPLSKATLSTSKTGAVKLPVQQEIELKNMRVAADQANNSATLAAEFAQLNKGVDTGGVMALPGAGAAMSAFNPKMARMVAIANQLTPAMRNGLPGAASDRDVAMFRAATVGVDKPREANLAIAAAVKAGANRMNDRHAFFEQYARDNGTILGAQEQWMTYANANPLFEEGGPAGIKVRKTTPWRQAIPKKTTTASAAPASGAVRTYNPATGNLD